MSIVTRGIRQKRRKIAVCSICGQNKEMAFDSWYCNECQNEKRKRDTILNKKMVFEKYGGKCWCCGESIFEFLCIDHFDGTTVRERKTSYMVYLELLNSPKREGIRVSCFNCNSARAHYGECPHQRGKNESDANRRTDNDSNSDNAQTSVSGTNG